MITIFGLNKSQANTFMLALSASDNILFPHSISVARTKNVQSELSYLYNSLVKNFNFNTLNKYVTIRELINLDLNKLDYDDNILLEIYRNPEIVDLIFIYNSLLKFSQMKSTDLAYEVFTFLVDDYTSTANYSEYFFNYSLNNDSETFTESLFYKSIIEKNKLADKDQHFLLEIQNSIDLNLIKKHFSPIIINFDSNFSFDLDIKENIFSDKNTFIKSVNHILSYLNQPETSEILLENIYNKFVK